MGIGHSPFPDSGKGECPHFHFDGWQVSADIARERVAVQRERSVEDLIARLDVALAERSPPPATGPSAGGSPR
jgi:hypothetical protein